ncbi:MAG: response regulator transcription factor [Pyrinomonadaceae bacterium]
MDNKIRILIAEDHEMSRQGLRMLLEAQGDFEVCGEAPDGREAIRLALETTPDIVLMDISMPELNGLLAAAKLKRVAADIKIIALSRHQDTAYLHEMFEAGVSGYVLKQSDAAILFNAIRAVAKGSNYLDPAVAEKVMGGYAAGVKLRGDNRDAHLTEREEEILREIAWGLSNKEIADKIEVSVKTVESHKANAQRKLNISSRNDLVRYAALKGWLRED